MAREDKEELEECERVPEAFARYRWEAIDFAHLPAFTVVRLRRGFVVYVYDDAPGDEQLEPLTRWADRSPRRVTTLRDSRAVPGGE